MKYSIFKIIIVCLTIVILYTIYLYFQPESARERDDKIISAYETACRYQSSLEKYEAYLKTCKKSDKTCYIEGSVISGIQVYSSGEGLTVYETSAYSDAIKLAHLPLSNGKQYAGTCKLSLIKEIAIKGVASNE